MYGPDFMELINGDYEYTEFYLDSGDARTNFGGSEVSSLDWPIFRFPRPLDNVAAIKVLEAEIPFTYYVVNSTNNTFTVSNLVPASATITIPVANYTAASLATAIALGIQNSTLDGHTYTGSILASGKIMIESSSFAANDQFSINFSGFAPASGINYAGATVGTTYTSTATGAGGRWQLILPYIPILGGPNSVYINSQRIGAQLNAFVPNGPYYSGAQVPIIAKVQVEANPYDVSFWQDSCPEKWFCLENMVNLTELDLYCTNPETGQLLQFNGASFSVKLGIIVRNATHQQNLSGSDMQNRVIKRLRPN